MSARHVAAVLAVSAAALLGSSGIAFADGDLQIPGARLTFDSATDSFRLWDTADDGHSVYADGMLQGGTRLRFSNNQGPNTEARVRIAVAHGRTIWYRVCVDKFGPGNCSPWKEDHT